MGHLVIANMHVKTNPEVRINKRKILREKLRKHATDQENKLDLRQNEKKNKIQERKEIKRPNDKEKK